MTKEETYRAFIAELEALEGGPARNGVVAYLADSGVDEENVAPLTEADGDEFWSAMLSAAEMAAAMRAEAAGEDINELLGRVIY